MSDSPTHPRVSGTTSTWPRLLSVRLRSGEEEKGRRDRQTYRQTEIGGRRYEVKEGGGGGERERERERQRERETERQTDRQTERERWESRRGGGGGRGGGGEMKGLR